MASKEEEERIVKNLSIVMLGKLRANGWKDHWRQGIHTVDALGHPHIDPAKQKERALFFLDLLQGEVEELKRELAKDNTKPAAVVLECADVANMAAMLADIIAIDSPDPVGT
jgi:hypothetical protein